MIRRAIFEVLWAETLLRAHAAAALNPRSRCAINDLTIAPVSQVTSDNLHGSQYAERVMPASNVRSIAEVLYRRTSRRAAASGAVN